MAKEIAMWQICLVVFLTGACLLTSPGTSIARAEVPQPSRFAIAANDRTVLARVEAVLSQVKKQVAPDERISVFNVKATQQGRILILTGQVLTREQKDAVARAVLPLEGINEIQDDIAYFPYPQLGDRPYALARYPVVHLRTNPRNSAELCTEVLMGAALRLLATDGAWARVQVVDDGYVGWAPKHNLVGIDEKQFQSWTIARRVLITSHRAALLDAPAPDAQPVGYVLAGTQLQYFGAGGGFFRLELPGGKSAYVRSQEGRVEAANPTPERDVQRILATARSFLGVPYLWGGTSALMFDCSGFTQIVYRVHGYRLPRDADQQQAASLPVKSIAELKPGDLVFFDKGPDHMGIYLGHNRVIHASSSKGGVVINSLDPQSDLYDAWLHDNFRGGGRVVKD